MESAVKAWDIEGIEGHHWAVRVQISDSSGDWYQIQVGTGIRFKWGLVSYWLLKKRENKLNKKNYSWSAESGAGALGGTIVGKTTKSNEDIETSLQGGL